MSQRTRMRHSLSYLDQVRGGAVLRWNARARAVLFGGYYFQPQQVGDDVWAKGHRFFGGVETARPLRDNLLVTARIAAERLHNTGRPDYSRYRSYLRLLVGTGTVAPYFQNEFLAVRQGFHSMRNSGGLRWRMSPRISVEGGFLYEVRRTVWGGDRAAIVTAVRYQWTQR